jgi:spermidine/putrescine-binding protein
MKTINLALALGMCVSLLLVLSCCSISTNSSENNELNLISPNGYRISKDITSLKEEARSVVARQRGEKTNIEITGIRYYTSDSNCLSLVYYKLQDGTKGNFGKISSLAGPTSLGMDTLVISSNEIVTSGGYLFPVGKYDCLSVKLGKGCE